MVFRKVSPQTARIRRLLWVVEVRVSPEENEREKGKGNEYRYNYTNKML